MGIITCCGARDKDNTDSSARKNVKTKDLGAGTIEQHLIEAEEELGFTEL